MRLFLALALALMSGGFAHAADDYPVRPIRIVVGYAPGGVADIAARLLGTKLGETWKQQVIVENRTGASGTIALESVARANPDGYTLLGAVGADLTLVPHLYSKLTYRVERDFAPIVFATDTPLMFAAHAKAPFNTIRELIEHAKTLRDGISYSSPGTGSLNHITGERFALETGAKLVHVPYRGGAPAAAAIAGGEVPFGVVAVSSAATLIKSGRVKAIAVTMPKRVAAGPDWPTMAEAGVPGFVASNWVGFAAPSGTPADVLAKLNAELNRALAAPEVREKLAAVGAEPVGSTADELARRIREESDQLGKLVARLGIKPE